MLTKIKFLQIAAAALLLLNLGLLAYMRFGRPPKHDKDALKRQVIDILRFDNGQVAAYEQLIDQHRQAIKNKETEMLDTKKALYALLQGNDFSARDSLVVRAGKIQQEIEGVHFDHFLAVKKLCRPDQIDGFRAVTDEMLRFFSPGRGRGAH